MKRRRDSIHTIAVPTMDGIRYCAPVRMRDCRDCGAITFHSQIDGTAADPKFVCHRCGNIPPLFGGLRRSAKKKQDKGGGIRYNANVDSPGGVILAAAGTGGV